MLRYLLRSLRRRRAAPESDVLRLRRGLAALGVYLGAVCALHVLAMMVFEGLGPGDAAWLTATTVTTVGYGDASAATTAGRWSTVILLYFGGIFALAKGAGDWFDYRAGRRALRARGRWRWHLRDHVLFVNAPSAGAERYFETLLRQLRGTEWGAGRPVLILCADWPDGLPASLSELGVVHVHGRAGTAGRLEAADAAQAACVVVLAAEEEDPVSDGVAFDVVHRLAELGVAAPIVVECVDDGNRERLRKAGAGAFIRPVRGYPEMTVRALVAPGSEAILENLFTRSGDKCLRYEAAVDGAPWGRLAAALLFGGAGTAIGYARPDGRVETNPPAGAPVRASALYVVVKEGREPTPETVRRLAAEAAAAAGEAAG